MSEKDLFRFLMLLGGFITVFTVCMYLLFRWWQRKDEAKAESVRKHPGAVAGKK